MFTDALVNCEATNTFDALFFIFACFVVFLLLLSVAVFFSVLPSYAPQFLLTTLFAPYGLNESDEVFKSTGERGKNVTETITYIHIWTKKMLGMPTEKREPRWTHQEEVASIIRKDDMNVRYIRNDLNKLCCHSVMLTTFYNVLGKNFCMCVYVCYVAGDRERIACWCSVRAKRVRKEPKQLYAVSVWHSWNAEKYVLYTVVHTPVCTNPEYTTYFTILSCTNIWIFNGYVMMKKEWHKLT